MVIGRKGTLQELRGMDATKAEHMHAHMKCSIQHACMIFKRKHSPERKHLC